MTREPGGRNNAFKHGAFAQDLILPGENGEDLQQLHERLIEEWQPEGILEQDTVLTLTKCVWLKRRVERFYYQEATWAQEHPSNEELNYVDSLSRLLDHSQSFEQVIEILAQLPQDYKEWIERDVPQTKYKDVQSWVQRLKSALHKLMVGAELVAMERQKSSAFKAEKAALLRDLTTKKITLDERLDSRIDKAVKRLAQLKAFKQVIGVQGSQVKGIEHRGISDQR